MSKGLVDWLHVCSRPGMLLRTREMLVMDALIGYLNIEVSHEVHVMILALLLCLGE